MTEVATDTGQGSSAEFRGVVDEFLTGRQTSLPEVLEELRGATNDLSELANLLVETLRAGRKVLSAGNGGSAAEAQHFAAEFVGRFLQDRKPYAAICLNTDTSILTALANDYSYDDVFARQVEALAQPEDVFVAYSTSGESENLVRAADAAKQRGARVVALTGARQNRLAERADVAIRVPSAQTPIVQEVHLMVTHLVCGIAEAELARSEGVTGRP